LKKNNFPLHIEKEQEIVYSNAISKLYRLISKKVRQSFNNLESDKIVQIENEMYGELGKAYLATEVLSKQFTNIALQLDSWAYRKLQNYIKKAMLKNKRKFFSIVLQRDDPIIQDFITTYTKSNVELVQALGKQYIPQVSQLAGDTFFQGGSMKDLTYNLRQFTENNRNKAKFWARDQVGDAYSEFTHIRQTSAGITEYIWRTVGDNKVRGLNPKDEWNHAQLEGMVFNWKTGASKVPGALAKPGAKHPGDDYNDRCTAEPIIE